MLNIEIKGYKLVSDGTQIIIEKEYTVDPTKSPNFKEGQSTEKYKKFKTFKYAGKLEHAIDIIMRDKVFNSDSEKLKELKDEIVSFKEYIANLLES